MTLEHVAIEVSEDRRHDAGSWRAASVCRNFPTRWWFGGDHRETVRAKEICAGCVVRVPCLEFALGRPELLGVWAATTPTERVALRRGGAAATEIEISPDVGVRAVDVRTVDVRTVDVRAEAEPEPDIDVEVENEVEVRLDLVSVTERPLAGEPLGGTPRSRAIAGGFGEGDELFTPAEAARKLGVTPNTVTRWSRAGKILAIQTMGGHRRFRRSEIERVLGEANVDVDAPVAI